MQLSDSFLFAAHGEHSAYNVADRDGWVKYREVVIHAGNHPDARRSHAGDRTLKSGVGSNFLPQHTKDDSKAKGTGNTVH